MALSVVVPVYNSEQSLGELYQRLTAVLANETPDFEIIFVDDSSRDHSFERLRKLHEADCRVKIIRLAKNYGQQPALFCGLNYVTGDLVITIDDDLQHPPEEIPILLHRIEQGYDVVFGIPVIKRHSRYRNFGSRVIDGLLGLLCHKPKAVKVSSFRVLRSKIVREVCRSQKSFIYLAPLIFRATTKVANVAVRHETRKYGRSGYNFGKLLKLSLKLVIHYSFLDKLLPKMGRPKFEIAEIDL